MEAASSSGPVVRDRPPDATIDVGPAVATWASAWVIGMILVAPIAITLMGASVGDTLTIPQLTIVSVASWTVMAAALIIASRRAGSGRPLVDYAASFRPIDAAGVPLGLATQFVFVPLLYLPLRGLWPDSFTDERIEERAQELADRAGGWLTVLLVIVVVIGAPLIEEFVYRGLLQRSVAKLTGPAVALALTSIWFALVHFSAVEYPGLFLAGVVFGGCVVVTGRLGPAIVTHAAFNAAGLFVVLNR